MDTRPVVFIDSGIGGIPYCSHFLLRNPDESIIYLADRLNFPYGQKARDDVARILLNLVDSLISKADPKLIVLACNTATVCGLKILREKYSQLPFVGTVPAIKPAVQASKTKNIGLLATERTVNETNIKELKNQYAPSVIHGIAAPDLVEFVEKHLDDAQEAEKLAVVRRYVDQLRGLRADVLVLGCTHFLFLADEFHREADPDIQVFDSIEGITRRVEFLLDESDGKLRADTGFHGKKTLALTGTAPPDLTWVKRGDDIGFTLSLLEDL